MGFSCYTLSELGDNLGGEGHSLGSPCYGAEQTVAQVPPNLCASPWGALSPPSRRTGARLILTCLPCAPHLCPPCGETRVPLCPRVWWEKASYISELLLPPRAFCIGVRLGAGSGDAHTVSPWFFSLEKWVLSPISWALATFHLSSSSLCCSTSLSRRSCYSSATPL